MNAGDILMVDRPDGHQFGHWRAIGTDFYTFQHGDFIVIERVHKFGIVGLHISGGRRVHLSYEYIANTCKLV